VQKILDAAPIEVARDELEIVAASLARTPRLETLLRYLAQRYLEGETDQLTEYNIATEVFGRKKTEFIASEDAIARVETHRLRKKLAAYYETEGRSHAVRISIPLGGYVPLFTERVAANGDMAKDASTFPKPQVQMEAEAWSSEPVINVVQFDPTQAESGEKSIATALPLGPWLGITASLLLLLGIAAGVFALRSRLGAGTSTGLTGATRRADVNDATVDITKPNAAVGHTTGGIVPVSVPFRMIAGYTGPPQRDNAGDVWESDRFFDGGWARHQRTDFIARTGSPFVFRYGRAGDTSYNIPLVPGSYELHLYFMQGSDTEQSEDVENKAIFNVHINNIVTLNNFDIVSDAMGRNVADERVFRDVSPSRDGMLHIQLTTALGTPSLSAIQILPNGTHAQLPIRLVMQPTSYTDRNGQLWRPDNYYLGGRALSHNLPESSADSEVLPFERYGHFEYALPVDTRDSYTVTLRFVELYFGAQGTDPHEDRRLFRVLCNGATLLDDFDINKEAGNFRILEKTFHHLKPSAQGKLNLDFEPISNYATVSSIEVLGELR